MIDTASYSPVVNPRGAEAVTHEVIVGKLLAMVEQHIVRGLPAIVGVLAEAGADEVVEGR